MGGQRRAGVVRPAELAVVFGFLGCFGSTDELLVGVLQVHEVGGGDPREMADFASALHIACGGALLERQTKSAQKQGAKWDGWQEPLLGVVWGRRAGVDGAGRPVRRCGGTAAVCSVGRACRAATHGAARPRCVGSQRTSDAG